MHLPDWSRRMSDHFGNPLLEQRKLASGDAYVLRDDEAVFEITGPDTKSWLHSLLTQNILNLKPGQSTEALLLTPQGHIEHQLKIIITEQGALLITSKLKLEGILAWLKKMVFRSKVEILERPDLVIVGGFFEHAAPSWTDGFSAEPVGSVRYAEERADFAYREHLVEAAPEGKDPAGLLAFNGLRIIAGRPEITDIDDRSLPHEFDWLSSAVHLQGLLSRPRSGFKGP